MIYLGFDSSTQSLTATAIEVENGRREVRLSRTFRFDDVLPRYGTRNGVLPSPDERIVHAPPLLWAEALELMLGELVREPGIDWNGLRAISGSAQQHGSVYLNRLAAERLPTLDPERPLVDQLRGVLARPTSPVWMDASTTPQCAAIEAALGGADAVARLTGSRAYERFTGPQIRRFAEEDPPRYAATDRVHLVSSWLASLLTGAHAPIDHGDGSGMNLMDLARKQWSRPAVGATAPDLARKLPPLVPSWTTAGSLARYWRERFGLPAARVVVWSGDNPCSLIGTGLVREGRVAVSLGTSDTIFGAMDDPRVSADGTGHVFASPAGGYFGMTVFRNGSLARERVRDSYGFDWAGVSSALGRTPPGNDGAILIPWFEPEITPLVLRPQPYRFELAESDGARNVRALIEGQMMALALHSRWMGVRIVTIHATGGAAANRTILQVMADVFDAEVWQMPAGNSAALGAALRAWHADRHAAGDHVPWEEIVGGFAEPLPGSCVRPDAQAASAYRRLIEVYARREREALDRLPGSSPRWPGD